MIYTHDIDFFAKDTPKSFYWAELIAADECVKIKDGGNRKSYAGYRWQYDI